MTEPKWLLKAREFLGVSEIKGPQHNPKILALWKAAKLGGIKNDEIPWCAGFVGGVLELCGIQSTRADSARSYLKWGEELKEPVAGAVVIFERGPTSGHVAFVIGRNVRGNLVVLGGNQGDMVSIAPFDPARIIGYRWPEKEPVPKAALPLVDSTGKLSSNEA